jgi:hypothetical protein
MIVAAAAGTLQLVTAIQPGITKQTKSDAAFENLKNAPGAYGAL